VFPFQNRGDVVATTRSFSIGKENGIVQLPDLIDGEPRRRIVERAMTPARAYRQGPSRLFRRPAPALMVSWLAEGDWPLACARWSPGFLARSRIRLGRPLHGVNRIGAPRRRWRTGAAGVMRGPCCVERQKTGRHRPGPAPDRGAA